MTYELTSPLGFEVVVCSRCCGTGNYSYNQVDGTRCYGCGGDGKKYTPRGKAAKLFYNELCAIDPADAKVGDRINNDGQVFTIAEILPPITYSSIRLADGTTKRIWHIQFKTVSGNIRSAQAGCKVKLVPQGEHKAALVAQALAYQDSLTAAGKPRKR